MIDPHKNKIPDIVKNIHLIAVCGTGMAALAAILKDLGYHVTGSDQNVYPPMSEFLREKQIRVFKGFDKSHIPLDTDLVVVGNAVSKDNPEVLGVMDRGLYYCSMPQAVNHFAAGGKKQVLVAGTHGKTTTSSIIASILNEAGLDPSFIIGGIVNGFNSNYRLGNGRHIVIEADEYDTAFFDKGPKFLHYDPYVAILTSIEFDHADIFDDLEHVKSAFGRFVEKIGDDANLIAYDEDENVDAVINGCSSRVVRYGAGPSASWQLGAFTFRPPYTHFEVIRDERLFGNFQTRMMGRHNLLNCVAAIAGSHMLGLEKNEIARGLKAFKGAKRRQEVRGVRSGITVMDDFAHHPTAVRETIRAVKFSCSNGRVIAVFEPRTNSSMRNIFQKTYARSFDAADIICVREPPLLSKIPENERFSSTKLVDDLKSKGLEAAYFPDTDAILEYLYHTAKTGDTVLVMSNGGFDNIHERLLKKL